MNVAIIGASADRAKFGNRAVRAYLKRGWTVFPINKHEEQIEGLWVFKSIAEIPDKTDRISIYLPPEIGFNVLDEIASSKSPKALVFFNPGSESAETIEKAKALGLNFISKCSIRDIGEDPNDY